MRESGNIKLFIWVLFLGVMLSFLQACQRTVMKEESCHFVQNSLGQRVSWVGDLPIELYIHESVPIKDYEAIYAAVRKWNALQPELPFFKIVAEGVQAPMGAKDGLNMIYSQYTWPTEQSRKQAVTTISWEGSRVLEADIMLNHDHYSFMPGEVDLESLVVHELGHVLGLEHNESDESVMRTSLARGELRREITPSDEESLRCEYL